MAYAIQRQNVMSEIKPYLVNIVSCKDTDETFSTMHTYSDEVNDAIKFNELENAVKYIKRLINSDVKLRDSLFGKYFSEANKSCIMTNNRFDRAKMEKSFNDLLLAFSIENTSTYNRYIVYNCDKNEVVLKMDDIGKRGEGSYIVVTSPPNSNIPKELLLLLQIRLNEEDTY